MIRAAVMGAAGYIGGELLRILLGHPGVEVAAAVSSQFPGRGIGAVHPNLRGVTDLAFCGIEDLDTCDVLFLATPHRSTMTLLGQVASRAKHVIDLSGDFRLRDPAAYERYYGQPHTAPELLDEFVTGCPELFRDQLAGADRISVPGCMATAAILALYPIAARGLIEPKVDVDARTGSSGSGATAGPANLHAERSGAMRVFAPLGHRHEAEIAQLTGLNVRMTATGVEAVRGVQVLCRATLTVDANERAIRAAYRQQYAHEPFVRLVAQRRGIYRYPEPKILIGSNFCDIGFVVDQDQLLLIAALDNLVKGGAGAAVHCFNIRMGWPERLGLEFPGLHPA